MSYTLQNSIIYNEAFSAYIFARGNAVASAGNPPSDNPNDPTGAAYTNTALINDATAFAQAVDTAIVNDDSISDNVGRALVPSSQQITQHQYAKTAAVRGACYAFLAPGGSWLGWMPGGPVIQPATGRGTTKLGGDHSGGKLTWIENVGNQILALYSGMLNVMANPAGGG